MEWLKKHAWTLTIAAVTVASTFTLYGYRIDQLEKHEGVIDQEIATLNSGSVTTQIALAKIQVDIDYIKQQLNKLVQ